MRKVFYLFLFFFTSSLLAQEANPQIKKDPRGEVELTVCNQNLENLGRYKDFRRKVKGATLAVYEEKVKALAERIRKAGCDVVALQEILGNKEEFALEGILKLSDTLRKSTGRFYEAKLGPSNDKSLRLGFLLARDRVQFKSDASYARVELPKTSPEQRPRYFARGPYEIQVDVLPRGEDSYKKSATLITFHFKSKVRSSADPAGPEFETYRMEMAEALRRVIESRHPAKFESGKSLLIVLGDRNSNFDLASARILEGSVTLDDFRGKAVCRLSKRGVPLCQKKITKPQRLFSVLTTPQGIRQYPGTYRYREFYSWIDDILVSAPTSRFAWKDYATEGIYDAGVIREPKEASDHALVYSRLNW